MVMSRRFVTSLRNWCKCVPALSGLIFEFSSTYEYANSVCWGKSFADFTYFRASRRQRLFSDFLFDYEYVIIRF